MTLITGRSSASTEYDIGMAIKGDFLGQSVLRGHSYEWHLLRSRALGFNTTQPESHGFTYHAWSEIEKEEGKYNWYGLDRYVDACEIAGLKTTIDVRFFLYGGIPGWLFNKYPDAYGIDYGGNKAGASLCHEGLLKEARRFAKAIGERYKNRAHIAGYIIGDEGGLYTAGLGIPNGMDFSLPTEFAFQKYLGKKYKNIGKLNKVWKDTTEVKKFEDIKINRDWFKKENNNKFMAEWLDWNTFRQWYFAEAFKEVYEGIKEVNPRANVMVSAFTPDGFGGGVGAGHDPYQFRYITECYATKFFRNLDERVGYRTQADHARGLSDTKEIWASNLNSWNSIEAGVPKDDRRAMSGREVVTRTWHVIGRGVKGIYYWMWVCYDTDPQMMFWDIVDGKMKFPSRLQALEENNKFLLSYGGIIRDAKIQPPEVAVIDNRVTGIQTYRQEYSGTWGKEDYWGNVIWGPSFGLCKGMGYILAELNYPVDYIDERDILTDRLNKYRVIVISGNSYVSEEVANILIEKVKEKKIKLILVEDAGRINQYGAEKNAFKEMASNPDVLYIPEELNLYYYAPFMHGTDQTSPTKKTTDYSKEWYTRKQKSKIELTPEFKKGKEKLYNTINNFLRDGKIEKGAEIIPDDLIANEMVGLDVLNHPDGDKIIIATNQEPDGSSDATLKEVKIRVKAGKNQKYVYIGYPYPYQEFKEIKYDRKGEYVYLTLENLNNVQVVLLTAKKAIKKSDEYNLKPFAFRCKWLDKDLSYRLPIYVYNTSDKNTKDVFENGFISQELNFRRLLQDLNENANIKLSSVKMVEYDNKGEIKREIPCRVTGTIEKARIEWNVAAMRVYTRKIYYIYFGNDDKMKKAQEYKAGIIPISLEIINGFPESMEQGKIKIGGIRYDDFTDEVVKIR